MMDAVRPPLRCRGPARRAHARLAILFGVAVALVLALGLRARAEDHAATQATAPSAQAARNQLWAALRRALSAPAALPEPVREELRVHGLRVARLQRIRALCIERKDQASLARADKLLGRELERHRVALNRIWPAPAPPRAAARRAPQVKDDDGDEQGEPEGEDDDGEEGKP